MSKVQLAANRANAKKSTGPRTAEGEAAVAQNAVTHGITSFSPVLSTESQPEFDHLEALLRAELNPRTTLQEVVFNKIVLATWNQDRLRRIEEYQLEIEMDDEHIGDNFLLLEGTALSAVAHQNLAENSTVLLTLNRQLSRLDREFHRNMRLYLELHGPLTPGQPQNIAEQNKPISPQLSVIPITSSQNRESCFRRKRNEPNPQVGNPGTEDRFLNIENRLCVPAYPADSRTEVAPELATRHSPLTTRDSAPTPQDAKPSSQPPPQTWRTAH